MWSIAMIPVAFLCGALPFSVWLTKIFLKKDVRQYGDGNPGATNVFRAGSNYVGLLALLLDISKAALPVGLAYFNLEIRGLPIYLIATAPVVGHLFSPFLGFKGGKALATVLGVWIGLTIWKASLAAAITAALGIVLLTPTGWAVMLAFAGILTSLLIWLPDPILLLVWLTQTLIQVWTHRADLRQPPRLRPWLADRIGKPNQ
ncbi:MAG TPA: hypothetical protein DCY42_11560 [Chloroflexi bacterium]|nr:hypothetical protein [Chloroflexota bacterium]